MVCYTHKKSTEKKTSEGIPRARLWQVSVRDLLWEQRGVCPVVDAECRCLEDILGHGVNCQPYFG